MKYSVGDSFPNVTFNWLDEARINRFEKDFYVINTSRGKVLKQADLLKYCWANGASSLLISIVYSTPSFCKPSAIQSALYPV